MKFFPVCFCFGAMMLRARMPRTMKSNTIRPSSMGSKAWKMAFMAGLFILPTTAFAEKSAEPESGAASEAASEVTPEAAQEAAPDQSVAEEGAAEPASEAASEAAPEADQPVAEEGAAEPESGAAPEAAPEADQPVAEEEEEEEDGQIAFPVEIVDHGDSLLIITFNADQTAVSISSEPEGRDLRVVAGFSGAVSVEPASAEGERHVQKIVLSSPAFERELILELEDSILFVKTGDEAAQGDILAATSKPISFSIKKGGEAMIICATIISESEEKFQVNYQKGGETAACAALE